MLIGLLQLTRHTTQAVRAATPRSPDLPIELPPAPVAEPSASSAPAIASRERPSVATTLRGNVAMPGLAPGLPSFASELKRDADGNLVPIMDIGVLRAQIHVAGEAMNACIERSGQRPTGKATLNFTVVAKNNKLVIDFTGVQDEDTLAGYPALLECMHQTANLLVVDGQPIPELGTPMYVRRHVRLDSGVLAEDSIFNFSYLH